MKFYLLLGTIFLFFSGWVFSQDRTISGTIISGEDQSPLPGVSVLVKGSTLGTASDALGKYKISLSANGTKLVFSFVGFITQEVDVGNRTTIDIVLQSDDKMLNEIVVTALGIERQEKELGYKTSSVKSEELTQAKAINIASALSGKVAGLQINTADNSVTPNTRIVLRGNRSLLGNNQALIVIDGTQVPSSTLNFLNANDIDNVTVLKGANAAALYGSDASNGALIITTKKGSVSKPIINYTNTSYLESVNFLPSFQNRFGGGTENYSRVYIPFENQSYGPEFDGKLLPVGRPLEDGTSQTLPYQAYKNAKKEVWDIGSTVQNDLSFSAGDLRSKVYVSLQNITTKGIVPKDTYQRTGGRVNASNQYGMLKAGFNVSYYQGKSNRTTSDFYFNVLNTAANVPLNAYRNWQEFKLPDGSLNPANPNNYFNDYYNNPFFDLDNNRQESRDGYLTGNIELELKPLSWLTAIYRIGLTNNNYSGKGYSAKYTFNDYPKIQGKYNARDIAGSVYDYSGVDNRLISDFIITGKKTVGSFSITGIIGHNYRQSYSKNLFNSASSLVVPGLYNVSNRVGEPSVSESSAQSRIIGVYGDFTFGYKDYLFFHVSGRNDWTSLLGENSRSFFYPCADISFVLTDAFPSLRSSKYLNAAKLRVSASKVGNVNIEPYALQTVFNVSSGFPYGGLAGFTVGNNFANPNIKPEFTNSYEIGGEFALLEDRINVDIAYYQQRTINQTVSINTSTATGYSSALINAGIVANSGFELELKTTPIRLSNGFSWDISLNYSNTNNKVVELYQGLPELNLSNYFGLTGSGSLGQIFAREGEQFPIIKVVAYDRSPDGRVIVDPFTGYPRKASDLKIMGQVNPRHRLGISTSLIYKGINFRALAEYRGGNVIYHGLGSTMWFTGVAATTAAYGRERFVFPNSVIENIGADGTKIYTPNTSVAVQDGGLGAWDANLRNFGENFVTSGAFWKLREVALTYTLPKSLLAKAKVFREVSVGFVGRNLIYWFPKGNLYTDPEFSNSTSNATGLNNTGQTPPTRTYGFTLTIGF